MKLLINIKDERMTLPIFKQWLQEARKELYYKSLVTEADEVGRYIIGIIKALDNAEISEIKEGPK